MSEPLPTFPEFGQGGDAAGQRRSRRSFRYTVLAIFAFSLAMRVYEGYAKLELRETQYVSALTLAPESARPILRNAIRRETESAGQPTPLYVEALAGVEETDKILPTYESAARLRPNNQPLLLKFGCELFQQGKFEEAREKFREAGVHPPKNPLPSYLEAAALAASFPAESDLGEAVAIIARANSSGALIVFPEPLWHATLPRRGVFYANHRRTLNTRLCAPLLQFKQLVLERAKRDIEAGTLADWDAWLQKLEEMGKRITNAQDGDGSPEITHVVTGINIEHDALDGRMHLAEKLGVDVAPMAARIEQLDAAMSALNAFENERQASIDTSRAEVKRPFILALGAIFLAGAAYLLVWIYGFLFGAAPQAVALHHTRLGITVLLGAILAFAITLAAISVYAPDTELATNIVRAWFALMSILLVFGAIYPSLSMPRVRTALARVQDTRPEARQAAIRTRRSAGVALARRYFGVFLGGVIIVFSVWFILFRLSVGVYPDQFELLVTGAEDAELAVITQARVQAQ